MLPRIKKKLGTPKHKLCPSIPDGILFLFHVNVCRKVVVELLYSGAL